MALAWSKIIIPIKLSDINPYGFIKKIQALKCRRNHSEIIDAVATTVFVLMENKEFNKFKEIVIDSVIEAFNKSDSFKTTRIIIRILTKIKSFNSKQIDVLKKAIRNNGQVYNEIYALPNFKKMLKKNHKIVIDSW
jgi:hypothetical protein